MTDLERLEEIERAGKSTESYENGCMQVSLLTQEFEFLLNYARRAIVAEAAPVESDADESPASATLNRFVKENKEYYKAWEKGFAEQVKRNAEMARRTGDLMGKPDAD